MAHHALHSLPRLPPLGGGKAEHLHFVKLMHPEDSKSILSVTPHLPPEAGREACVTKGELGSLEPATAVEGTQGLLAGCDQVLVVAAATAAAASYAVAAAVGAAACCLGTPCSSLFRLLV